MPRSSLLHLVTGAHRERSALVAADRYWDAVVRDEPFPDEVIDPTLAATIHRIQDLDDAPLPDPAFVARLENELLPAASSVRPVRSDARDDFQAASAEGAVASLGWPALTRRVAMNVAAAAALLIIVVASTLVSLWGAGRNSVRDPYPAPTVLAPGITDEKLLLRARFDTIPDGVLSASISRWVLQPGAEVAIGQPNANGPSPAAYLVEAGALSVRPDMPTLMTRAGATTPTPVAEAAWTTLLPGDRMFAAAGSTALWRNDGTHPVRVLEATFASRDVRPQPSGVLNYPVISDWPNATPDRPVVMTVIAVTLHPEGALPAALVPGLTMLKVESGRLVASDVDETGNPLPPVELGHATRFLGSFPPGRVFRSGNDEPVRLLLVTMADANSLGTGP